jgi:CHAT domain-containing protein/tetratricopeptide (TPR) repeat protein
MMTNRRRSTDSRVSGTAWVWLFVGLAGGTVAEGGQAPGEREGRPAAESDRGPEEIRRLGRELAELYAQGRYREATAKGRELLGACEKSFGPRHPTTAAALSNLALVLEAQGDYAAARPLYERAFEILKQVHGERHPAVATCQNNLAELHKAQGDYAAARGLHERALATREAIFGREHTETAQSLNNLALLHYARGDLAAAKPLLERALAIYRAALGGRHPATISLLNNLAGVLVARGEYAAAQPLYDEALEVGKQAFGEDHPAYASLLTGMADLRRKQGDYAAAQASYERALAIRKRALGGRHPETAQALNNLAVLFVERGNYATARPLYEQALAIRKEVLGQDHPDVASSLNTLADLAMTRGDYAAARPLYEQALAVRRRALGPDHPDTAEALNNLAALFAAQADYAAARPLYEQALAIREKVHGPRHPDVAATLNNLATLLISQGRDADAEPLLRRALEILREAHGPGHPHTAVGLSNLAGLLSRRGDHAAARLLYEQALKIRRKALGPDHPDTAIDLNNLAAALCALGEGAAARTLYEQALEIERQSCGERHPTTAIGLLNLAVLDWRQGDPASAGRLMRQGLEIVRGNVDLASAGQSERQQLTMVRELRAALDGYLSLSRQNPSSAGDVYRFVLAWKGSVFARQRATRLARRFAERSGRPEVINLIKDLEDTAGRLATLALSTPDPGRRADWRRRVAELTERKEKLESELMRAIPDYRERLSQSLVDPDRLRTTLPPDTALVDLLEYEDFSLPPGRRGALRKERRLVAFIVRSDRPVSRLELGAAAPIDGMVAEWEAVLRRRADLGLADGPGTQLRRAIWERLEPHLAGARTVLISPDGALARLPLAALPGGRPGIYLIEERVLATVPVPGDLPDWLDGRSRGDSRPPVAERDGPALLLVGDVDFDAAPGRVAPDRSGPVVSSRVRADAWKRFVPLPATRDEIAEVRESFRSAWPASHADDLRRGDATEGTVRRLAPRSRYLHLATHGFFAGEGIRSALDPTPDVTASAAGQPRLEIDPFGGRGVIGFHPGLLSGLALAGANRAWVLGQDDGVLTSLEVAEMDLSGVELAVLSACQTGLGAPSRGEGLLGLQRTFQVAGVRSVVAAFWSVDDEATRVLMARFYENLWTRRMGRLESLREAQLWMLRGAGRAEVARRRGLGPLDGTSPTTRPGPTPNLDWAAFVLSGDWR